MQHPECNIHDAQNRDRPCTMASHIPGIASSRCQSLAEMCLQATASSEAGERVGPRIGCRLGVDWRRLEMEVACRGLVEGTSPRKGAREAEGRCRNGEDYMEMDDRQRENARFENGYDAGVWWVRRIRCAKRCRLHYPHSAVLLREISCRARHVAVSFALPSPS